MFRVCLLALLCGAPLGLAQEDDAPPTFPARFLLTDGTTVDTVLADVEAGAFVVVEEDSLRAVPLGEVQRVELLRSAEGPRLPLSEEDDALEVLPRIINELAVDAELLLQSVHYTNELVNLYGKRHVSRAITITASAGGLENLVLELARGPRMTIVDLLDVEAGTVRFHWFVGSVP